MLVEVQAPKRLPFSYASLRTNFYLVRCCFTQASTDAVYPVVDAVTVSFAAPSSVLCGSDRIASLNSIPSSERRDGLTKLPEQRSLHVGRPTIADSRNCCCYLTCFRTASSIIGSSQERVRHFGFLACAKQQISLQLTRDYFRKSHRPAPRKPENRNGRSGHRLPR